MAVSILSGLEMKPCTRSEVVSGEITGSPSLTVISLGVNSNFFALISITLGLDSTAAFAASCALARLIAGGTIASPISHTPARRIVLTILLNIFVFIFLLVFCVAVSMFEHLIHSDRARKFGHREFHFLDLQVAAVRIAVDAPEPEVLERLRLVEGHRFFYRRYRGVGEREDKRAGRIEFRAALLMKVLAMDMTVKHGHVFIRRERVHHLVAGAGEPFPFGLQIEQRT